MLKHITATVLLIESMIVGQSPIAPTLDRNNTWTGTNTFKYVNNVRYADQFPGVDIGAKLNAAFADCSGAMCTVIVSPGSFTYTTEIVVPAPGTIECKQGAILNYGGAGKAVKLGPDDLTVSTYSANPYHLQGCTFTGGASATHGVYVNQFVTKVFIESNYFHNFGNSAAYNIWLQGQNWDARINDNYMWVDNGRTAFNGIGQGANDPANGTSGDFGQSQGYILNNHIQSSLVGINANGIHLTIGDNTITGAPAIRLGSYSHFAVIRGNTMEAAYRASAPCIQHGDPQPRRGSPLLQGVVVEHNQCNAHNASFGNTSHFIGPTTSSGSISVWTVYNNNVADLTSVEPLIVMNNLSGQRGNYALANAISNTNTISYNTMPPGRLHTTGGNIDPWIGTDEVADSRNLAQFPATLNTTAATADDVSITGVTASSKCSLTPTNASAAANIATTYISAKAANKITVTHLATAAMTYDILCSAQ